MSILGKIDHNTDYDGLSENSTDIERVDVFFSVLARSTYGEYIDSHKLKLGLNKKSYFEAFLRETNFVTDISGIAQESCFKLTSKAIILLNEYGSYSNYLKYVEKESQIQKTKNEERENLEMQKLRGEIDDLTNRLFDYDAVKSRSIRSDRLAIIAIILTVIGLVLQWLSHKND